MGTSSRTHPFYQPFRTLDSYSDGLEEGSPIRGSLTLPRMNAHRLVIVAAALTVAVTAALATALTAVSGQALPRAVRHDLGHATGTSLSISGSLNASQAAQYNAILPAQIRSALGAALATFSGQALPRAIRHDLGTAAGTPLVINGPVNAGQAAQYDSILPARISSDGWPWPRRPRHGHPRPGGDIPPAGRRRLGRPEHGPADHHLGRGGKRAGRGAAQAGGLLA